MKKKILIINDEVEEVDELQANLETDNTEVCCAFSASEALRYLGQSEFGLIILDADLSAASGHQIMGAIKKLSATPIMILSSRTGHTDRLAALKAGAHAYIGKPYTLDECLAQAQSLMQLYLDTKPQCTIYFTLVFAKGLTIDTVRQKAFLMEKDLQLTRKEYKLLEYLASNPGRVFSREQIYANVWDELVAHDVDNPVKNVIKTLRQKLSSADIDYIKNVWGVGYRFDDETHVI